MTFQYVNPVIRKHLDGQHGIHFLNVTPNYIDMRESARRVNIFDGHSRVRVNWIVADSLVRIVKIIEKKKFFRFLSYI